MLYTWNIYIYNVINYCYLSKKYKEEEALIYP